MTITELDAQLANLRAALASVAQALPTSAERFGVVEAELRRAEQLYRERGLNVSGGHPDETAHLQRQAVVGACMVVGADKMLKAERQRIEAQGEGLTAADKARRLDELRAAILKAAARRELLIREENDERDDFLVPRPIHPELAIFTQAEIERLAG